MNGLRKTFDTSIRILDYAQHATGSGADAKAVCYVEVEVAGIAAFGIGRRSNIVNASFEAIISGINRTIEAGSALALEAERLSA